MNIKKFIVKNLFSTFEHKIEFNNNVTLIMGENGVGKTMTLKLIDAIFNRHYEVLLKTEFESISIEFPAREKWTIIRKIEEKQNGKRRFFIEISSKLEKDSYQLDSDMLSQRIPPYFEEINDDRWLNRRTGVIYSRLYMMKRYNMDLPQGEPEWMQNQLNKNKVRLIETQRLHIYKYNEDEREHSVELAVDAYAKELSEAIQKEIAYAMVVSNQLDRTFPKRLIKFLRKDKINTKESILKDLKALEERRKELSSIGLQTENVSENASIKDFDESDKTMLAVMQLYVEDSQNKLKQYDDIYQKVSILSDIINSHFKRKVLTIDSTHGFLFKTKSMSGEEFTLPLSKLSSGEQNELVLFYELLFKCGNNDLIMIDEPEISLHLEWLQTMVGDLKRIVGQNKSSLLIATHSPDLVGDNYDLVQNLE